MEELERWAGRDSSTSSRPSSSDSPYKKKGKDRSLRERGKRRPGKQPGDPGNVAAVDLLLTLCNSSLPGAAQEAFARRGPVHVVPCLLLAGAVPRRAPPLDTNIR